MAHHQANRNRGPVVSFFSHAGLHAVPLLVGVFLLTATGFKAYQLITEPVPGSSLLTSHWLSMMIVFLQLFMGLNLLAGVYLKSTRLLALLSFLVFASVNSYKVISGDSNCGCFGSISIPPLYALLLDVLAFIAPCIWRPAGEPSGRIFIFLRIAAPASALLIGLATLISVLSIRPASIGPDGAIAGDSQLVMLEPQAWIGRRFPVIDHMDIGQSIADGQWVVIFYHNNCSSCQRMITEYEGEAVRAELKTKGIRVAFVEVPSRQQSRSITIQQSDPLYLRGQLNKERDWFMRTPVIVQLENAQVISVTGDSSDSFFNSPVVRENSELEKALRLSHVPQQWASHLSLTSELERPKGFPDYRKARRMYFLNQVACGPLSLIAILKHLGIPENDLDLNRILSAAGTMGTDFGQLRDLASEYNMHCLGAELSVERLKAIGLPSIVLLNGTTFAAVPAFSSGGIEVIYPLQHPAVVSDDDFKKAFGVLGRALLIAKEPLSETKLRLSPPSHSRFDGPKLRTSKNIVSVGRIYNKDYQATLTLSNIGSGDLEIEEVVPSCPCLKVTVDQKKLAPDQTTTLRVQGENKSSGPFSHDIVLKTNQSNGALVRIPLRGFLEPPVFFDDPAVILKSISQYNEAYYEAPVEIPSELDLSSIHVRPPTEAPMSAALVKQPDGKVRLAIKWRGSSELGMLTFPIYFSVLGSDTNLAVFLFGIEVVPSVDVFPPFIVIRDSELSEKWSRRICVKFNGPNSNNFSIKWSNPSFEKLLEVAITRKSPEQLILDISPKDPLELRAFSGIDIDMLLMLEEEMRASLKMCIGTKSFAWTEQ